MEAEAAVGRLAVAGGMVPSTGWFLYGFVRKEAVQSSQIEGTQASLGDVLAFEATHETDRPGDVEEVCNYVHAVEYARRELADPHGLPIGPQLLCEAHRRLMQGARGGDTAPGEFRRVQNWIGGVDPTHAKFVPPPPDRVVDLMADLERWIHADDPLPALVKAGLAHVQFETIHPFLDGNGRIGRLLIALLLEHWGVLEHPLLYLSHALRRRQMEYYSKLSGVRRRGDWEGWTVFYLECVRDAAEDGVRAATRLAALGGEDRRRASGLARATVASTRLMDLLPEHPVVTGTLAADLLEVSAPTARKAIELLVEAGVLREISGKQRDRVFAYQGYLRILTGEE